MRILRSCAIAALVLAYAGQEAAGQGAAAGRGNPQGPGAQGQATRPAARPPRDTPEPRAGTAVIRGRVLSADSGSPVRRAQIRLSSAELRENRMASTDTEGRYEFRDLSAGRYTLSVGKGGYVTLQYGQRRPLEAGRPLEVAEGQTLDKVDFNLPRGSVIAGRVTDEYGEPISDAMVQAMRYQYVSGQRRLVNAGRMVVSDDIGQFRVYGLPPGTYVVSASIRSGGMLANAEDSSGYAPTYYPGTASMAEAQRIPVALGQELAGISFALIPARLSRVSGTVVNSQGQPLAGGTVVLRTGGASAMSVMMTGTGGQTGPDGSFTVSNVAPGEYLLEVRSRPRDAMAAGGLAEFASLPITIAGEDISGLTIVTGGGTTVAGRVVFEGRSPPPASRSSLQVNALSPNLDMMPMGRLAGDGRVVDNGSFELRGLSGPRLMRLAGVPAGWTLKSVTLGSTDITDLLYEFRGEGTIGGLEIVLTDRVTDLSGAVKDARDETLDDYVVVVFPEDSSLWGFQSRFIRTGRPDRDGRFDIKGLPPGQYLAIALESLEQGTESDPDFLEQVRQRARGFSLKDGQTLTLDLDLAAGL